MVKYTLLHKPTLSSWPSIPRQIKTIFAVGTFITVSFLILVQASRNERLKELYNMIASTAEILDLEIKYMPQTTPESDERWRPAYGSEGAIYSAYLDVRPEIVLEDKHHDENGEKTWAVIRVIAILPLETDSKPLSCYFKFRVNEKNEYEVTTKIASRVKAIQENWNLKYSAFFVLCDLTLPANMNYKEFYYSQHLPIKVALGFNDHEDLTHLQFIDIHYPQNSITQTHNDEEELLAICGPVFHHEYNRALHLVEYIEYNSMLGVDHFTFYNASVTPEVSKVFEYYAKLGVATILQWQLPSLYKFELTLRVDGYFAALNDCLYRSSFYRNYKYVMVSDVDEFIVPRKHQDFKELLNYLDPPNSAGVSQDHASFIFRNVFFYIMYQDDETNRDPEVPYLLLQAKTERVTSPEKPRFRSKYIARSRDVVELGNHNVWTNRPGTSAFSDRFDETVVDEEVALSHHYRDCEAETAGCYLRPTVVDRTAHKYLKELGKRVAQACTAIFKDSGCPAPID